MELQLRYMALSVFIFDIDGCIMPNLFSLTGKTSVHSLSLLSIYPEFVEFYKQCCPRSQAIYFLTGRKQAEHGEVTEEQLKPLRNHEDFTILYYPEGKFHDPNEYFEWKANSIKAIMNQWDNPKVRFYVYDDLEELFPILLRNISPKLKDYRLQLIQSRADWIKETKDKIPSLVA